MFKERRIYSFQEVNAEAKPEQVESLKKALSDAKSLVEFVNYLKANNIRFTGNEAVRGAEQLPLASIDQFAKMKDGQAIFNVRPGGVQILSLAASRSQPLTLAQATPAIEQFLLNERKRKLVADDLKRRCAPGTQDRIPRRFRCRRGERSPYKPPAGASNLPPLVSVPATLPASAVLAAPQVDATVNAAKQVDATVNAAKQVDAPPIDTASASMPSGAVLDNGLKGIK